MRNIRSAREKLGNTLDEACRRYVPPRLPPYQTPEEPTLEEINRRLNREQAFEQLLKGKRSNLVDTYFPVYHA